MSSGQGVDRNSVPAGTTTVSFLCQTCSAPLKLAPSLTYSSELDAASLQSLTGMLPLRVPRDGPGDASVNNAGGPPTVYREITSPMDEMADNMNILTPKQGDKPFHATQVAQHLFNVMSGRADVDHPLCEECTDSLLDQLDAEHRRVEEECREASEFLKAQDQAMRGAESGSLESAQKELDDLKQEEAALIDRLKEVDKEQESLKSEEARLDIETKRLEAEEKRYWKEYNEYQLELGDVLEENATVTRQYRLACRQLEKLKKTNVFNDVFHIWHDGHFGTINNFRLGRLPTVPVGWDEINAAWGQTVLLLHTMALRLGVRFVRYRLVPYGSQSKLVSLDDQSKELPLYGRDGIRMFWEPKFDQAMVAFLDCLQQFKDHVESKDAHFKLPYFINKDKIGDSTGELSIRIQLNHEEIWTRALKFMLTNVKWCLAWVCKQMS
eukprot:m.52091 g.52091  ORF g.52091 m.52091 type:complete len:439 (-) comp7350_c0_seq3:3177-4493(-)